VLHNGEPSPERAHAGGWSGEASTNAVLICQTAGSQHLLLTASSVPRYHLSRDKLGVGQVP